MWKTGSDLEGLVLLAISTFTANCQQASLSCGGQGTPSVYIYRLGGQSTSSAEDARMSE